jgi:pantoate--beta-alanine ligase
MQVIETIHEFRAARHELQGSLGLVPTMGYLHQGHLALVERAKAENDHVAVSIFVNPTQFGPNEDFTTYPRDPEHDLAILHTAGVALVFAPAVDEMYPDGFQTYVEVTDVSQGLEGARRPGHFRGVATVVAKLFNVAQPDRAYFGQKDAQQVAVIRRMVADLAMPLEIVVVPTERAPDGLALSSRNAYLNPEQRAVAPLVYQALTAAKVCYDGGERSPDVLRTAARNVLASTSLIEIDYVSAADGETLAELDSTINTEDHPVLMSIAVRIGRTRLIDNVMLGQ